MNCIELQAILYQLELAKDDSVKDRQKIEYEISTCNVDKIRINQAKALKQHLIVNQYSIAINSLKNILDIVNWPIQERKKIKL